MRKRFTPEQGGQIRTEHEAGASVDAIARDRSSSRKSVRRAIVRAGGRVRSRGEANRRRAELQEMSPRRLFTPEQERQIREEYEAGVTSPDLAKKWGGCDTTIRHALRRAGAALRARGWRRFTPQQERQIAKEYIAGASSSDVAAKWGADDGTVLRCVRAHGGTVRDCNASRGGSYVVRSPEVRAEIAREYVAGASVHKIARRRSLQMDTVRRIVTQQGVPLRPPVRYEVNAHYFDEIDTPAKARWLGWLAGDGCLVDNGGHVRVLAICMSAKDRSHLEAFRTAIGSTHPIREKWVLKKSGKWVRSARLAICCVRICQALMRQGLGPRKSFTLEAWKAPEGRPDLQAAWWAGLCDADGCITRPTSRARHWKLGIVGSKASMEAWADYVEQQTGERKEIGPHKSIWKRYYARLATVQHLARLFYATPDGSVPLERKRLLAEQVLATVPVVQEIVLSPEQIADAISHHGTLKAASESLGVCSHTLGVKRRRLGMPVRQFRSYKHVTADQIEAAYRKHGEWKAAARELGVPANWLSQIRKKFGITLARRKDYRHMTAEQLRAAYEQHGTWEKAAAALGIPHKGIHRLCRSTGLLSTPPKPRGVVRTCDEVLAAYEQSGGVWSRAAKVLGIDPKNIFRLRRRLGL